MGCSSLTIDSTLLGGATDDDKGTLPVSSSALSLGPQTPSDGELFVFLLSLLPTLPAAALAKVGGGSVFFAEVGAGKPGKLDVGRDTKRRGESADSVLISVTPPDDLFLFLSVVVSSWLFSFSFIWVPRFVVSIVCFVLVSCIL